MAIKPIKKSKGIVSWPETERPREKLLHSGPEYQVWKLLSGFLPEFMALMIRTEYFLSLVDFNRVGGVKQRMYYDNLAEIQLPMIDLETQKKYADRRIAILSTILTLQRYLSSLFD